MDGICANCGLAYAPDARECAQCGQELGGKRRGFFARLFGRDDEPPPHPQVVRPARKTAGSQRIEIVGPDGERRVYDSMDDVPAADRADLERAQDLGESLLEKLDDLGDDAVTYRSITTTTDSAVSISVDGDTQVYDSFDDLPPDVRARIQQAFDQVEQLGIDMPDLDD